MRNPGFRDVSVELVQENGKTYIQFTRKKKEPARNPFFDPPAAENRRPTAPRAPVMDGDLPQGFYGRRDKLPAAEKERRGEGNE